MNQDDSTITTVADASGDLHLATELARVRYENSKEIKALTYDWFVKARESFEIAQKTCVGRETTYRNALRAELAAKK